MLFWANFVGEQKWRCRQREGCASHRATGSRERARVTTTAHWCAGTKASPAANAEASVTAASALRSAEIS